MEQVIEITASNELAIINQNISHKKKSSSSKAFIESNTIESSLEEIKQRHIIPVWLKDNEPLISHSDFIETTAEILSESYSNHPILLPSVRLSHPIKGRVPSAKDKPAHLLLEDEKTLFYERMMFVIEVPGIQAKIGGNKLSLTIGGVKSFTEDNLYQRSGGEQHFKVFIGFQNHVCTNLCVWSDGYVGNLTIKSKDDLVLMIHTMINRYNTSHHLFHLKQLTKQVLTEQQFANLIGRAKMYNYMPNKMRQEIPELMFGEQQVSAVVRDYFKDESFCRDEAGNINLWQLYNLFTGANKSSYIDSFLDKSVNAYSFAEQLRWALEGKRESWYLK
jgi:hypothetical protein